MANNQSPYFVLGYPCEFHPTPSTQCIQDHRSYFAHPTGTLSHFGTEPYRYGMGTGEQEARYGKQVLPAQKMNSTINTIKQEAKKEEIPWPGSAGTRIPPEWIPDQRRVVQPSSAKKEDGTPESSNSSKTKPKRVRTAFTPFQLLCLETSFERNHYVVGEKENNLLLISNSQRLKSKFGSKTEERNGRE